MIRQWALLLALVGFGLEQACADTIELKEKAAVVGKVLAEKPDQVAVDVGYTVLVIPRNQILRIDRNSPSASRTKYAVPPPGPASEAAAVAGATEAAFYTAPSKPQPARTVLDLVKQIGEAVVQVRTPGGLGSGFFINEDGFLITNFHVIENETQISVEVYHQRHGELDRKTYKQIRIIALNKFADLALLKVDDRDAPKFKYVDLGSADALSVGEKVFAIGSPLGLERTVTEGILSTKTREMAGTLYLQTTAQINPGNSGGPLFNMSGDVIGVTNMKATAAEGLGFAIPVESVKFFLDHRDAFAYANDNPGNAYRYLEPPSHTRHSTAEP
ncbi:MAG TPA: trypsin-like peptidase domain-containing protein [Candidatus Acidoferrum sp.]|nr:trypsin-like peptidase domain-containing protein [Candidatus Acidoferrum sp.]